MLLGEQVGATKVYYRDLLFFVNILGDIAFRFMDKRKSVDLKAATETADTTSVTVCDINVSMMEEGKKRCSELGFGEGEY